MMTHTIDTIAKELIKLTEAVKKLQMGEEAPEFTYTLSEYKQKFYKIWTRALCADSNLITMENILANTENDELVDHFCNDLLLAIKTHKSHTFSDPTVYKNFKLHFNIGCSNFNREMEKNEVSGRTRDMMIQMYKILFDKNKRQDCREWKFSHIRKLMYHMLTLGINIITWSDYINLQTAYVFQKRIYNDGCIILIEPSVSQEEHQEDTTVSPDIIDELKSDDNFKAFSNLVRDNYTIFESDPYTVLRIPYFKKELEKFCNTLTQKLTKKVKGEADENDIYIVIEDNGYSTNFDPSTNKLSNNNLLKGSKYTVMLNYLQFVYDVPSGNAENPTESFWKSQHWYVLGNGEEITSWDSYIERLNKEIHKGCGGAFGYSLHKANCVNF